MLSWPPKTAPKFLSFLVAIIVATASTCAAAAPIVGTVTKVQKQAQTGAKTAVVGTPIYMHDEIPTGRNARLQVTFSDETTFSLGMDATVVLDR
jgi:hypothetical protein